MGKHFLNILHVGRNITGWTEQISKENGLIGYLGVHPPMKKKPKLQCIGDYLFLVLFQRGEDDLLRKVIKRNVWIKQVPGNRPFRFFWDTRYRSQKSLRLNASLEPFGGIESKLIWILKQYDHIWRKCSWFWKKAVQKWL